MTTRHRWSRRRGFTLIELLVVIVIIVLLASIALPTLMSVKRQALRGASITTIHNINGAIRQYANDFDGELPPSRDPEGELEGKQLLAQLLAGFAGDPDDRGQPDLDSYRDFANDDGSAGAGFRMVRAGKVYGPYNGTDGIDVQSDGMAPFFVDAFKQPILYYKADRDPVSGEVTYHEDDNTWDQPDSGRDGTHLPDFDKYIDNPEAQRPWRNDYLLMSRGPDTKWTAFADDPTTDDVTNFLEEE